MTLTSVMIRTGSEVTAVAPTMIDTSAIPPEIDRIHVDISHRECGDRVTTEVTPAVGTTWDQETAGGRVAETESPGEYHILSGFVILIGNVRNISILHFPFSISFFSQFFSFAHLGLEGTSGGT